MSAAVNESEEYPRKADLRRDATKPLPKIAPGTIDPNSMTGEECLIQAKVVLDVFNEALASNDAVQLASCFYAEQAFWRDIVALTSHLRTIFSPDVVAAALLKMFGLRGLVGNITPTGDAQYTVISPSLMFIDFGISFEISSPALKCEGRIILLPVNIDGGSQSVCWKIWVLSTWVGNLVEHPEDETLLLAPGRDLDNEVIETEVLIVGGGSSGLMMAARLKALSVESVVIDRNAQVGDNWALRYDSVRLHVPTATSEMPYTYYRKELQSPNRLSKDDIAKHLRDYASKFHLNIVLSTVIQSSVYNASEGKWTIRVKATDGSRIKTIVSKHLVQATGLGSDKPYLPPIENRNLYKGLSIHSTQYRNAPTLAKEGVKSVLVVGSANTAFDIMQDCYNAGLETTLVARSPTYIFPFSYVADPHGFGLFDTMPLDAADRLMNTLPYGIDGQFIQGLFGHLASMEPDRYLALAQAGYPVIDSLDPSASLQHHLLEACGGHNVDEGPSELIVKKKVAVRGLVEPVAFTENGVRLSDKTTLAADAVIWCTGFADKNVRKTAEGILGVFEENNGEDCLGPAEITARLDATYGVDAEGEVRGLWKRQLRMENYWVHGGAFMHQRWWSRPLAQQIKLALEGKLPAAYRDTPTPE